MHYPYLVSTTCVSAGIIALGAVLGNWPGGSAQIQPCYHVLDGLPYAHIMCVSQGLECGSHAAASAVLTIRCVSHHIYPGHGDTGCARFDHRVSQASMSYLRVDVLLH